jgi:putative Mg2+ transporter-C (MgtC) family protein
MVMFDAATIDFLTKITLAVLFGGAIGLERSIHNKSAGFRTMILICMSSTMFMKIGMFMLANPVTFGQVSIAVIVGNTITGIGFLGAGSIIKNDPTRGSAIEGLTTAATIWFVAGIGLLLGIGLYLPAFLSTAYALITLLLFSNVEHKLVEAIRSRKK